MWLTACPPTTTPSAQHLLRAGTPCSSGCSLKQHYRDWTCLIPELLHATSADGRLDYEKDGKLENFLQTIELSHVELPTMALLNNYDGVSWHVPEMAPMLGNESRAPG